MDLKFRAPISFIEPAQCLISGNAHCPLSKFITWQDSRIRSTILTPRPYAFIRSASVLNYCCCGLFAEIHRIRMVKPRIIDSIVPVAEKRHNRARSTRKRIVLWSFIDHPLITNVVPPGYESRLFIRYWDKLANYSQFSTGNLLDWRTTT